MNAANNPLSWFESVNDARVAWSITCFVLAIPLLLILWYLFKRRQPLIDRCKSWLATRPLAGHPQGETQRNLRELQGSIGSNWFSRALRGRHLQSALCLGSNAQSLQSLLHHSAFGFARRGGIYAQNRDNQAAMAQGFGWAKHDNFVMLAWANASSSEDAQTQSWSTFLRLARHSWPFRKVRYLLLCVDLQEIMMASANERQARAQAWGQRLHLASLALGYQLPVYILVQGLDALPGFDSYINHSSHDTLLEPWGWTSAQAQCVLIQGEELEQTHHAFTQALMSEVLCAGLDQDAGASSSSLVDFAQSFCKLSEPLLDSLHALLEFRFSNEAVPLRGVFFSGQAHEAPVFHRRLLPELYQSCQGRPKATPRVQQRRMRSKQLAFVALGLTLAATWILPFRAVRRNQRLQDQMQVLLDDLAKAPKDFASAKTWAKSFTLDQELASLRETKPWGYRFGMSQAALLEHGSRSLFVSLCMRWGVLPMLLQDQRKIRKLSQSRERLDPQQSQELRNRLFRYLMLSQPSYSTQPELRGKVAHRLTQSLAGHWSKHHRFSSPGVAKQMATRFVAHLSDQAQLRVTRDEKLVQEARSKLDKADLLNAFAHRAIEKFSRNHAPLRLDGAAVAAAFTATAWNESILPSFQNYLDRYLEDAWILGFDAATSDHLKANAGLWLSSTYANAFEQAWKQGINAQFDRLSAQSSHADPLDLEDAYALAFEKTAVQLQVHTKLQPILQEGEPSEQKGPDPIAALPSRFSALLHFSQGPKASGLAQYLDLLRRFSAIKANPEPEAAKQRSYDALLREAETISGAQPRTWRPWFKNTLRAPILQAKQSARVEQRVGQSIAWCELSNRLHEEIFDRYPFKKQATKEVALLSLTQLLHPSQGELWRFLESEQGIHFAPNEGQLRPGSKASPLDLHPRLNRQLHAIWRVANALFPEGAKEARLSLLIRARATHDVSALALHFGDQNYKYPSKDTLELQWPTQSISSHSNLFVKHGHGVLSVKKRGLWSLFHLLESGQSQRSEDPNRFFVAWRLGPQGQGKARLTVRVKDTVSPFFSYPKRPLLSLFRSRWLQSRPPLFKDQRKCRS